MLFQMCFSLYCCREQLQLRHFDIKLLNFFCTKGSAVLPPGMRVVCDRRPLSPFQDLRSDPDVAECRVWLGTRAYCLPLPMASQTLVKLADFGTSAVGVGGLGDRIGVQQFTTLENTPPEYLLLGSAARQSFSADTFMLGLSLLHLLTGHEPYEVLLANARCPLYLCNQLRELWTTSDPEDPYFLIRQVVDSLDFGPDDGALGGADNRGDWPGLLLCDTLYRYLVMFGSRGALLSAPPAGPAGGASAGAGAAAGAGESPCAASRAWRVLWDALGLDPDADAQLAPAGAGSDAALKRTQKQARGARGGAKHQQPVESTRERCIQQYRGDCQQWSFANGAHPVMRGAREVMADLYRQAPGGVQTHSEGQALDLLTRLVHFDPSKRCVTLAHFFSSECMVPSSPRLASPRP